jgi:hypothetical protein
MKVAEEEEPHHAHRVIVQVHRNRQEPEYDHTGKTLRPGACLTRRNGYAWSHHECRNALGDGAF